jgi:hypothetical protein
MSGEEQESGKIGKEEEESVQNSVEEDDYSGEGNKRRG